MPIKVPNALPAIEILQKENIFVMDEKRAITQDIRELKIAILNLMPIKQETEVQLLRLLSNTPLQIEVVLVRPLCHDSKNTPHHYLKTFYKTFHEIKTHKFDGLIITGAPVEQMPFEEVNYWDELTEIMKWSKTHVTSTFHICWGAQAGLYYHYGIPKYNLDAKMFGIFKHYKLEDEKLLQGLDDIVNIPHSRHSTVKREDIDKVSKLKLLLYSEESGVGLVISDDGKQVFMTGHGEYDPMILDKEYKRDLEKKLPIQMPKHYYKDDDMQKGVVVSWRSHMYAIFSNWLNYYVYQVTPYNLE